MSIDMSQHFTFGTLLKYVAPSIGTLLLTSVYGIVDGLFVSNFAGKTAFAAVNFIMPIIMILAPIGLMVGTGGNAVVSKTRGEGNGELANRQFSLLVYFNLFCGIAMAIMGFLLIPIIARAMGATGEMLELCVTYGRISMLSLPFFMMQLAFQAFSATAGKPNLSLKVAIAAGVTNIALDFILVGALHMGVVGAALATVASEYVGGGACLVYFALPNKSFLRLGKTSLDLKTIGRTCVNGSSEMMSNIALSVVSVAYNLQLMRYIGPDGVAAYGVIMYCGLVFGSIFIGYSIGSAPLMAFQYGARKHREMRNLLKKGHVRDCGDGSPAHREDLRLLRRRPLSADHLRFPSLFHLVSAHGIQHLRLFPVHLAMQWQGFRAHQLPAHTRVRTGRGHDPAGAPGGQRHLVLRRGCRSGIRLPGIGMLRQTGAPLPSAART